MESGPPQNGVRAAPKWSQGRTEMESGPPRSGVRGPYFLHMFLLISPHPLICERGELYHLTIARFGAIYTGLCSSVGRWSDVTMVPIIVELEPGQQVYQRVAPSSYLLCTSTIYILSFIFSS